MYNIRHLKGTSAHSVEVILQSLVEMPAQYDHLLKDLLALPFDDGVTTADVRDVVKIFINAVKESADDFGVEACARMLVALVDSTATFKCTDTDVTVAKTLRKLTINRLQPIIEHKIHLFTEDVDEDGAKLSAYEIYRNNIVKRRYRSCYVFLGHLLLHNIVAEKVVTTVLIELLYGLPLVPGVPLPPKTPEEYELECFEALLRLVGPHALDKKSLAQWIQMFMDTVEDISELPTTSPRVKFMLGNLCAFWNSDWQNHFGSSSHPHQVTFQLQLHV